MDSVLVTSDFAFDCVHGLAFLHVGARNSMTYFYLLFVEVIYCFGPERWKAGCLLGQDRDEDAGWDVNPNQWLHINKCRSSAFQEANLVS